MAQKITSMLWFDGQAEAAAKFYVSVFKDGKLGKPMHEPGGKKVLVMPFEIQGREFSALNGGPQFKFNESVSFVVHCKDQEEVDYYWEKLLSGGGEESMCGWLKDKYGLSWQVTPDMLLELMRGPKAAKVMEAFMKMRRFDIAALKRAAA
jgi:predicted 3-demethylubiquinone-9 3-methyltransferase (glyoxalase superfamily)